jgi:CRP-like cAMP-binding protein
MRPEFRKNDVDTLSEPASRLNVLGENRLLAGLAGDERERVRAKMVEIELNSRAPLYEPEREIEHVYFPLSGVLSVIVELKTGSGVEMGTIGNEGMLGLPVFLGARTTPFRAFAQISGSSLRMSVDDFQQEMQARGALWERTGLHAQAWYNQVGQSAACNAQHAVEQRMCRWLLMSRDRMGSDEFYLTQEFLAQMLGVRRQSVSVVSALLQRAGLISYHRGMMRLLEVEGIRAASCECYESVVNEYVRLLC